LGPSLLTIHSRDVIYFEIPVPNRPSLPPSLPLTLPAQPPLQPLRCCGWRRSNNEGHLFFSQDFPLAWTRAYTFVRLGVGARSCSNLVNCLSSVRFCAGAPPAIHVLIVNTAYYRLFTCAHLRNNNTSYVRERKKKGRRKEEKEASAPGIINRSSNRFR